MATLSISANSVSIPGMVSVKATEIVPPPGWALMERQLLHLMEEAVNLAAEKYSRPDGTPYNVNDVDDTYEAHSYRGLLYAIGADDSVLEIGRREWNAITRVYDDGIVRQDDDPVHPEFRIHPRARARHFPRRESSPGTLWWSRCRLPPLRRPRYNLSALAV